MERSHKQHHNYTASIDPHDFEFEESIFSRPTLTNFILRFIPGIGFFKLNNSLYKEILQHAFGIETKLVRNVYLKIRKTYVF